MQIRWARGNNNAETRGDNENPTIRLSCIPSSLSDLENATLYNSIWRVLIFVEAVLMVQNRLFLVKTA